MNLSRRPALRARTLGAAAVLGVALALSGCGMDVQTLQKYTPAHGVNVDDGAVKVRNLLIVANDKGQGVLSGSFATEADDTLTKVTGTAQKSDGTDGGALTFSGGPVQLKRTGLAVLTAGTDPIRVQGADLKPGLLAKLQLTFGSGRATSVTVPVLASTDPIYAQVAPLVSPKPTPSATPSASVTPGATASPSASGTPR